MKQLLWLLPLSFLLSACPFESTVPMTAAPTEQVDTSLVGYWYGIVKEALEITKQSDSVYAIIRYGKAVKGDIILPDTAYFTGYTTAIGEQRFMNIEGSVVVEIPRRNKAPEQRKQKIFYMSAFERRNDTLSIKTIAEEFSPTKKSFKTPDDFKKLITESLGQQKNIYDDLFSLSYRKIQKPQPLKPF
jgi:hypothetical protein